MKNSYHSKTFINLLWVSLHVHKFVEAIFPELNSEYTPWLSAYISPVLLSPLHRVI